ncbi:hypothetical protein TST_0464 [Thermosulfidibacter takaii ABI70S6]|uniref:DUF374 domain-containing protein n=2 Tax=Thermosulfidibacter takaii TaxID=412593 RepID=A0A0S3QSF7_THET7|nr:hypothetical protein TST_0464 [Thermosulfidibacter takaii ABI70S6]
MDITKSSVNSSLSLKDRILIKTIELLVPPLARLYLKTIKTKIINSDVIERTQKEYGSFICAFWHNRIIPMLWANRNSGVVCLVSPSKDGEIIARILHRFGYKTVRGSSYKRPITSAKAVIKEIKKGNIVAIIPDGPRGPIYTVNPGVIEIARITKVPIIPATALFSSYWEVNSWDRFKIPKPFSKMIVGFGEPILINKEDPTLDYSSLIRSALFSLEKTLYQY